MSDQATHLRGMIEKMRVADSGLGEPPYGGVVSILPQSVPTGVMSYRPVLRNAPAVQRKAEPVRRPAPRPVKLAKAIAVTSGKGGVGKSNLAVNLAVAMSALGIKVALLDADLGLANADVLCNLAPRMTLEQVMSGRCRLAEAMMLAPGGFRLIPGASGVTRMADLSYGQRQELIAQLAALEQVTDVLLIDCGAGISANVVGIAAAASSVVVMTTPEPTAITDGYAMIKSLYAMGSLVDISLVVNMVYDESEGHGVFRRINRVSQAFLRRSVAYAGSIPSDSAVTAAVRQRVPFVLHAPDGEATIAVRRLARKLAGIDDPMIEAAADREADERGGFFSRLALWLGIVEMIE